VSFQSLAGRNGEVFGVEADHAVLLAGDADAATSDGAGLGERLSGAA